MIRPLGAHCESLTPDLCREFRDMKALLGERPLKPVHVAYLANELKDGRFLSPTWHVAIVQGTTVRLRADGQHSSRMLTDILDSPTPERFPQGLQAMIVTHEIDSEEEDGPILFNIFDNPHSTRTNTDAMAFSKASYPDLTGLDEGYLFSLAQAIHFSVRVATEKMMKEYAKKVDNAKRRNQASPLHPTLPPQFIGRKFGHYYDEPKYREFANWLRTWKDSRNKWILKNTGVTSEILDSWLKSSAKDQAAVARATRFWGFVFREDSEPNHPSRVIVDTIKDWRSKPKPKADKYRKMAHDQWSVFVQDEEESLPSAIERLEPLEAPAPATVESPLSLIGGTIPVAPLGLELGASL